MIELYNKAQIFSMNHSGQTDVRQVCMQELHLLTLYVLNFSEGT